MANEEEIEKDKDEEMEIPDSSSSSEDEDEDFEVKPKEDSKLGIKKRDAWERETPYQRSARKAEYKVLVSLQEDKDKAIREQAKSLVFPLEETEKTIEYLKGQAEPEDKKERTKLVRRIEGLRRSRQILHSRLYELCVANKHGWKVVTSYKNHKLTGEEREVQKAVERVRKAEEAAKKQMNTPEAKMKEKMRIQKEEANTNLMLAKDMMGS